MDNFKFFRTLDVLFMWSVGPFACDLAQSAKFVGVQFIPIFLILGIFPQLPVFE